MSQSFSPRQAFLTRKQFEAQRAQCDASIAELTRQLELAAHLRDLCTEALADVRSKQILSPAFVESLRVGGAQ